MGESDSASALPDTPEAAALLANGEWTLEKVFVGPELGEFPLASKMDSNTVSMQIHADGSRPLKLLLKVANTLRFMASPESAPHLYPFQALRVTPGASTKMMGPPAIMEAEAAISKAFMSVNKWLVREDTLLLVGPAAELSFRRVQKLPDGSNNVPNAKNELIAKMDEIRALKAKISSQGANSAEITDHVAPLIEDLKVLKQKVGPARFKDVVPMKMPTKAPMPPIYM